MNNSSVLDVGIIPDPDAAYVKVSGRGRLHGKQLGVLREVAAWREREARRRDMPSGWLVKDPSLVELARQRDTNGSDEDCNDDQYHRNLNQ